MFMKASQWHTLCSIITSGCIPSPESRDRPLKPIWFSIHSSILAGCRWQTASSTLTVMLIFIQFSWFRKEGEKLSIVYFIQTEWSEELFELSTSHFYPPDIHSLSCIPQTMCTFSCKCIVYLLLTFPLHSLLTKYSPSFIILPHSVIPIVANGTFETVELQFLSFSFHAKLRKREVRKGKQMNKQKGRGTKWNVSREGKCVSCGSSLFTILISNTLFHFCCHVHTHVMQTLCVCWNGEIETA